VGEIGIVLDLRFEVAGEVGVGLSEDREENNQLLVLLLPFRRIGFVAEGVLQFSEQS
jgi:hypothetical protein